MDTDGYQSSDGEMNLFCIHGFHIAAALSSISNASTPHACGSRLALSPSWTRRDCTSAGPYASHELIAKAYGEAGTAADMSEWQASITRWYTYYFPAKCRARGGWPRTWLSTFTSVGFSPWMEPAAADTERPVSSHQLLAKRKGRAWLSTQSPSPEQKAMSLQSASPTLALAQVTGGLPQLCRGMPSRLGS